MLRRISEALHYSMSPAVVVVLSHLDMVKVRQETISQTAGQYSGGNNIDGVPLLEASVRRSYIVYESYDGPIVQLL